MIILPLPDATPVDLLDLHEAHPERYPFLLESVAGPLADGPDAGLSRYDILFAFPGATLRLDASFALTGEVEGSGGFLGALDAWWRREAVAPGNGREGPALPFRGGWFLFLGYELVREAEPSLRLPAGADFPVASATRVPVAVVRDRGTGDTWVVAEASFADEAQCVVDDLRRQHASVAVRGARLPTGTATLCRRLVEPDPTEFRQGTLRIKAHIAAGDVYQVNLSRRWRGELHDGVTAADLYRRLRITNPAPFAGLATFGSRAIVSSSPERLVARRGDRIETRPIAGTRPRGATGDPASRAALRSNAKEQAEHVMLIDLERNDLGRVCEPGSVTVNEFMAVESYAHVHHIASSVTGRLRPGILPGELIRAVFPGGTITGCPKIRCMTLIAELEAGPRGPYTGSMGYLSLDGDLDLNILIRSLIVTGRDIAFSTGSGIVADSDPQREVEETLAKARGLLLGLGLPHDAPAFRA